MHCVVLALVCVGILAATIVTSLPVMTSLLDPAPTSAPLLPERRLSGIDLADRRTSPPLSQPRYAPAPLITSRGVQPPPAAMTLPAICARHEHDAWRQRMGRVSDASFADLWNQAHADRGELLRLRGICPDPR